MEFKNLSHAIHNKYAIMTGLAMQFLVLPFLGFVTVKVFEDKFAPPVSIALLVVTSSPGGSYSNWWCSLFNADLALSVTMTAISTLLSSVMLPVNLIFYASMSSTRGVNILNEIDWRSLFTALAVVCAAISFGLYFSYRNFPVKYRLWANRGGMISGCILIFVSFIASSFTGNDNNDGQDVDGHDIDSSSSEETRLWDKDWYFYVGVALPCLLGCIIATVVASAVGLTKPERVTVAVECSYQNPGIATSVALSMFDDANERALALGVPLYYGGIEALILGVYCLICWKCGWTKAPKDENFFKVLGATYEVVSGETDNHDEHDDNGEGPGNDNDIESSEELEMQYSAHSKGSKSRSPARSRVDTGDTSILTHSTLRTDTSSSATRSSWNHDDYGDDGSLGHTPMRVHLNTDGSLSQIEEVMSYSTSPDTASNACANMYMSVER